MKQEEDNKKIDEREVAIKVENLSKSFRVPHEKRTSLKSAAINLFSKQSYSTFKALEGLSFEIKKGEFFGIIGRNGSGKSTLLKILAGIYVPDKGKIDINGKLSPFLELGVGFNPELTGRENIFLGGSILGLTKDQIEKRYQQIVDFSELGQFIDMKIKNYSSGMQVRLAFSLSIHVDAEILLMDEVLAVGDTNFQNKCMDQFLKYKNMGKTVVLVSHNIDAIREYCDKAILIHESKIYSSGEVNSVIGDYITLNIEKASNVSAKRGWIKSINLVAAGKEVSTIRTGEKVDIVVEYGMKKEIDNPIFGIIFRDRLGKKVFGTNTQIKNIKTGKIGKGRVKVVYSIDNILAPGTFTISPAIAYQNKKIIEWLDDLVKFRVVNPNYSSGGVVDLTHEIKVNRG